MSVARHGPDEELGCAQEDCGTLLPGEARPVLPGLGGGVDRLVDLRLPALVGIGEDVALLVRHHDLGRRAGRDVLTADHERQLDALGLHLVEPAAQLLPLGRAGRVLLDRFVRGSGRSKDAGGAHRFDSTIPAVSATHVSYEARGWGVGEIWLEGDRLLHHELPRPAVEQRGKGHPLGDRFVRYFAGEPDDFLDVRSSSTARRSSSSS